MTIDWLQLDSPFVTVVWQSTAWLLVGLVSSRLSSRHPARAHTLLFLCLLAAIVTPILSLLCSATGWGIGAPLRVSASAMNEAPPPLEPRSGARIDPIAVLGCAGLMVWLLVTTLLAVRLIDAAVRGRRILSTSRTVADVRLQQLAHEAAHRTGVKLAPIIRYSATVTCPLVWCWRSPPIILYPPSAASLSDSRALVGVLCHELAHCRRRDHIWNLLAEIVVATLPWHPLAWLARRRLIALSEQACDQWALAAGTPRTSYATALLDLVPSRRRALAPAAVSHAATLPQRIRSILDDTRATADPHPGRRWSLLAAGLVLAIVASLAMAQRRPPIIVADDLAAPAAEAVATLHATRQELVTSRDASSPFVVDVTPHELDLGAVEPGGTGSGRVWLVNTGRRPMRLVSAKANCGCTMVAGFEPGTLAPGAWIQLEITMTAPTEPGAEKTKTVTFLIEDQPPLKLPVHLRTEHRSS
jgi:beta-lactamase regulating signal transducer with metallopeptidase domain